MAAPHDNDPEALIPMLQAMQGRHGGLTRAALVDVARALGIPAQRVYGVATFYAMFDVPPPAWPRHPGVRRSGVLAARRGAAA